jgi:hypothetical protein
MGGSSWRGGAILDRYKARAKPLDFRGCPMAQQLLIIGRDRRAERHEFAG